MNDRDLSEGEAARTAAYLMDLQAQRKERRLHEEERLRTESDLRIVRRRLELRTPSLRVRIEKEIEVALIGLPREDDMHGRAARDLHVCLVELRLDLCALVRPSPYQRRSEERR